MYIATVPNKRAPIRKSGTVEWDRLEPIFTQHEIVHGAVTPETVDDMKDGRAWMPAQIHAGPRNASRVQTISAVVLDIEAPKTKPDVQPPPFEEVMERVRAKGLRAYAHTTFQHRSAAPRYRLILAVSRDLKPDELKPLGLLAADLLGLAHVTDRAALEPARLYYLPRCPQSALDDARSDAIDGQPLEVDTLMAQIKLELKQHIANPLLAAASAVYDPPKAEQVCADLKKIDPDCSYEQWRNVVWGVLSTGLPQAEELAKEWSQRAVHRYDEAAFNRLVQSYRPKPDGITYGTARMLAMAAQPREPQPLPNSLPPVAAFDLAMLPDALRPWVADIAERIGCPPDFVAVPAMVALGSTLGRKVAIRPQRKTDWAEVPNLWGLIVGRPGMLKSPALQQATAPLRRLAVTAQDRYAEESTAWRQGQRLRELQADAAEKQARKALSANANADVSNLLNTDTEAEPILKRYSVTNVTPEALGELMRQNPQGLLLERDEIMGFLRDLDREDHADHRAFMLETWAGNGSFTFDRIVRGFNLHIPAMCLSIIGTTQPGRLRSYVSGAVQGGAADDGLMQRFGMIVWPDAPTEWCDIDRWPDGEAKKAAWAVFDRLDKITPEAVGAQQDLAPDGQPEGLPYLRLDDGAHACFLAWRTNLEKRLRGDLHPAIESHLAKYRKLVPALALVCHLADGQTGPVCLGAVKKAIAWAAYLETHALRCYGAAIQPEVATARSILARIKKGDLQAEGFSSRDVWRPNWSGLTDRSHVKQALEYLVSMDWLLAETIPTQGRDATIYRLNPNANF